MSIIGKMYRGFLCKNVGELIEEAQKSEGKLMVEQYDQPHLYPVQQGYMPQGFVEKGLRVTLEDGGFRDVAEIQVGATTPLGRYAEKDMDGDTLEHLEARLEAEDVDYEILD